MLKASKKNVVVFNYRVNFNHFVVADVIFFAEFLQILNCFAVKTVGQKISDNKTFANFPRNVFCKENYYDASSIWQKQTIINR